MELRRHTSLTSLLCACLVVVTTACDPAADVDDSWATPTAPHSVVGSPTPRSGGGAQTTQVLRLSTSRDLIANTAASTNPILAPSPAGIVPLDEPEISDGFAP